MIHMTRVVPKQMAAAMIIAIYHLISRLLTNKPVSANPTMLPKSPLADQIPIAVPSPLSSNYWLVMVSRVGQAGNWKNPKIRSPNPGKISLMK